MKTPKGPLLYEGKAKRIFATDHSDQVLVEFKDDATAFNALKREELKDKGRLNCQISACLFDLLERNNIPTHYLGLEGDTFINALKVDVIPIEIVLRNVATGSLCKQTPIKEGVQIEPALLDLYYKDDSLGDPLLTNARLKLLGFLSANQLSEIEILARKVNLILKKFFNELDLVLVDFKLEMGIDNKGKMLIADEIGPDTCRFWDQRSNDPKDRILDKDRFRKDLGGVTDAYREILKRIQGGASKSKTLGNLSV